eukprot:1680936-Pyramimonas_sp.AAC.1
MLPESGESVRGRRRGGGLFDSRATASQSRVSLQRGPCPPQVEASQMLISPSGAGVPPVSRCQVPDVALKSPPPAGVVTRSRLRRNISALCVGQLSARIAEASRSPSTIAEYLCTS